MRQQAKVTVRAADEAKVRLTLISGGQEGADIGGLRAGKACGIPTGGWAPKFWQTEHGNQPGLAAYGLRECPEAGYLKRTSYNVHDATAIVWFGNPHSPGGRATFRLAELATIPSYTVIHTSTPAEVLDWLVGMIFVGEDHVRLMIAGNRESRSPGIGKMVERFVTELIGLLRKGDFLVEDEADVSAVREESGHRS